MAHRQAPTPAVPLLRDVGLAVVFPTIFLACNLGFAVFEERYLASLRKFSPFIACIDSFAVGMIFAQIVIFAIWAALFRSQVFLRTCYALLMIVAGSMLFQRFLSGNAPELLVLRKQWGAHEFGWMFMLVIFSAVQLVLSALSRWSGWQLRWETTHATRGKSRQFSLLEILGLPIVLGFPLVSVSPILESVPAPLLLLVGGGVVLMCLAYALLHLFGFLRQTIAAGVVIPLTLLGPVLLCPVSFYFERFPFLPMANSLHLGALAIGVPTALVARFIGLRFVSPSADTANRSTFAQTTTAAT